MQNHYEIGDDLTIVKFESVFVGVESSKGILANVGEIYRVPNTNVTESLNMYKQIIRAINDSSQQAIIGSDHNFDLIKLMPCTLHKKKTDIKRKTIKCS